MPAGIFSTRLLAACFQRLARGLDLDGAPVLHDQFVILFAELQLSVEVRDAVAEFDLHRLFDASIFAIVAVIDWDAACFCSICWLMEASTGRRSVLRSVGPIEPMA